MSTGTLYDTGNRFTHLSSAGTTVIRTTATRLLRVNINTPVTGGVIDVYNATTAAGEQVASIAAAVNSQTGSSEFDVALSGGLTVVVTNNVDATIIYQ